MNIEMKRLLSLDVSITSIKNDVMQDEDVAFLRCTFDNKPLHVLWTYTTGFSIPVFTPFCEVLKHVEDKLINNTVFHGIESKKGYIGLQEV